MFERYVQSLLESWRLFDFFENLSKDELNVSAWKGDVTLKHLSLKPEACRLLGLPVDMVCGRVESLVVNVPWKNISKEQTKVTLDGVYLLLCHRSAQDRFEETKRSKLHELERAYGYLVASNSSADNKRQQSNRFDNLKRIILANLQITIRNIHIVYEGSTGVPFSLGMSLEELTILSTDERGVIGFVEAQKSKATYKLVSVKSFSVYLDTSSNHMTPLYDRGRIKSADIVERLRTTMHRTNTVTAPVAHTYMVSPVSCIAKVSCVKGLYGLSWTFDIHLYKVETSISRAQLECLLAIYQKTLDFQRIVMYTYTFLSPRLTDRPLYPVKQRPRYWWAYAYRCVVSLIRARRSAAGRRSKSFTWPNIRGNVRLRTEYLGLFRRSLLADKGDKSAALLKEELGRLAHLTLVVPNEEIMVLRTIAHVQAELEVAQKAKEDTSASGRDRTGTKSSWLGGWFNSDKDSSKMSFALDKEEEKLMAELSELEALGTTGTSVPVDHKFIHLKAKLVEMKNEIKNREGETVLTMVSGGEVDFVSRPFKGWQVETWIDRLQVHDGAPVQSDEGDISSSGADLFPFIISPSLKKGASKIRRGGGEVNSRESYLVYANIQHKPLGEHCEKVFSVVCRIEGFEIVYPRAIVVTEILNFMSDVQATRDGASGMVPGDSAPGSNPDFSAGDETAGGGGAAESLASLFNSYNLRRIAIFADISVTSPIIIVPECHALPVLDSDDDANSDAGGCTVKPTTDGQCLMVLDLGHLTIRSQDDGEGSVYSDCFVARMENINTVLFESHADYPRSEQHIDSPFAIPVLKDVTLHASFRHSSCRPTKDNPVNIIDVTVDDVSASVSSAGMSLLARLYFTTVMPIRQRIKTVRTVVMKLGKTVAVEHNRRVLGRVDARPAAMIRSAQWLRAKEILKSGAWLATTGPSPAGLTPSPSTLSLASVSTTSADKGVDSKTAERVARWSAARFALVSASYPMTKQSGADTPSTNGGAATTDAPTYVRPRQASGLEVLSYHDACIVLAHVSVARLGICLLRDSKPVVELDLKDLEVTVGLYGMAILASAQLFQISVVGNASSSAQVNIVCSSSPEKGGNEDTSELGQQLLCACAGWVYRSDDPTLARQVMQLEADRYGVHISPSYRTSAVEWMLQQCFGENDCLRKNGAVNIMVDGLTAAWHTESVSECVNAVVSLGWLFLSKHRDLEATASAVTNIGRSNAEQAKRRSWSASTATSRGPQTLAGRMVVRGATMTVLDSTPTGMLAPLVSISIAGFVVGGTVSTLGRVSAEVSLEALGARSEYGLVFRSTMDPADVLLSRSMSDMLNTSMPADTRVLPENSLLRVVYSLDKTNISDNDDPYHTLDIIAGALSYKYFHRTALKFLAVVTGALKTFGMSWREAARELRGRLSSTSSPQLRAKARRSSSTSDLEKRSLGKDLRWSISVESPVVTFPQAPHSSAELVLRLGDMKCCNFTTDDTYCVTVDVTRIGVFATDELGRKVTAVPQVDFTVSIEMPSGSGSEPVNINVAFPNNIVMTASQTVYRIGVLVLRDNFAGQLRGNERLRNLVVSLGTQADEIEDAVGAAMENLNLSDGIAAECGDNSVQPNVANRRNSTGARGLSFRLLLSNIVLELSNLDANGDDALWCRLDAQRIGMDVSLRGSGSAEDREISVGAQVHAVTVTDCRDDFSMTEEFRTVLIPEQVNSNDAELTLSISVRPGGDVDLKGVLRGVTICLTPPFLRCLFLYASSPFSGGPSVVHQAPSRPSLRRPSGPSPTLNSAQSLHAPKPPDHRPKTRNLTISLGMKQTKVFLVDPSRERHSIYLTGEIGASSNLQIPSASTSTYLELIALMNGDARLALTDVEVSGGHGLSLDGRSPMLRRAGAVATGEFKNGSVSATLDVTEIDVSVSYSDIRFVAKSTQGAVSLIRSAKRKKLKLSTSAQHSVLEEPLPFELNCRATMPALRFAVFDDCNGRFAPLVRCVLSNVTANLAGGPSLTFDEGNGRLRNIVDCTTAIDFFNPLVSEWEPLLEETQPRVTVHTSLVGRSDSLLNSGASLAVVKTLVHEAAVELNGEKSAGLNTTLTEAMLTSLIATFHDWRRDWRRPGKVHSRAVSVASPFFLVNLTTFPVFFTVSFPGHDSRGDLSGDIPPYLISKALPTPPPRTPLPLHAELFHERAVGGLAKEFQISFTIGTESRWRPVKDVSFATLQSQTHPLEFVDEASDTVMWMMTEVVETAGIYDILIRPVTELENGFAGGHNVVVSLGRSKVVDGGDANDNDVEIHIPPPPADIIEDSAGSPVPVPDESPSPSRSPSPGADPSSPRQDSDTGAAKQEPRQRSFLQLEDSAHDSMTIRIGDNSDKSVVITDYCNTFFSNAVVPFRCYTPLKEDSSSFDKNKPDDLRFIYGYVIADTELALGQITVLRKISFVPALAVSNLLPVPIRYRCCVSYKKERIPCDRGTILPGHSATLPYVDVTLSPVIAFKIAEFEWSEWVPIRSGQAAKERDFKFNHSSLTSTFAKLTLNDSPAPECKGDATMARRLTIFSRMWLVDASIFGLQFGRSHSDNSIETVVGQYGHLTPVSEVILEHERFQIFDKKWKAPFLPTDRPQFADATGKARRKFDDVILPSAMWKWAGEWELDHGYGGDEDGWKYAFDFGNTYTVPRAWKHAVRVRRWTRMRVPVLSGDDYLAQHGYAITLYGHNDKIRTAAAEGAWSKSIDLQSDQQTDLVDITRGTDVYGLVYHISDAPMPFIRTRMVVFSAQLVVVNNIPASVTPYLHIRQATSKSSSERSMQVLRSGQSTPFHWGKGNADHHVEIGMGDDAYSASVPIDTVGNVAVQVPYTTTTSQGKKTNSWAVVTVRTRAFGSTSSLIAVFDTESPLYLIENKSSGRFMCSQITPNSRGTQQFTSIEIESESIRPWGWQDVSTSHPMTMVIKSVGDVANNDAGSEPCDDQAVRGEAVCPFDSVGWMGSIMTADGESTVTYDLKVRARKGTTVLCITDSGSATLVDAMDGPEGSPRHDVKTRQLGVQLFQDVVTEVVYEHERYNPLEKLWKLPFLLGDRWQFTDGTGRDALECTSLDDIDLPSDLWRWEHPWRVVPAPDLISKTDSENASLMDEAGWKYAFDFNSSYHPSKSWNHYVRRRCWVRTRRHLSAVSDKDLDPETSLQINHGACQVVHDFRVSVHLSSVTASFVDAAPREIALCVINSLDMKVSKRTDDTCIGVSATCVDVKVFSQRHNATVSRIMAVNSRDDEPAFTLSLNVDMAFPELYFFRTITSSVETVNSAVDLATAIRLSSIVGRVLRAHRLAIGKTGKYTGFNDYIAQALKSYDTTAYASGGIRMSLRERMVFIGDINIGQVDILLTVRATSNSKRRDNFSDGTLGTGEKVPLLLRSFAVRNLAIDSARLRFVPMNSQRIHLSPKELARVIKRQYVGQLWSQVPSLIGSAEVFGVSIPTLTRTIGSGLSDFKQSLSRAPSASVSQDGKPAEVGRSRSESSSVKTVARGTTSLLSNTISGVAGAAGDFAKTIGANAAAERDGNAEASSSGERWRNSIVGPAPTPEKKKSAFFSGLKKAMAKPMSDVLGGVAEVSHQIRDRTRIESTISASSDGDSTGGERVDSPVPIHRQASASILPRLFEDETPPRPTRAVYGLERSIRPYAAGDAAFFGLLVTAHDGIYANDHYLGYVTLTPKRSALVMSTERMMLMMRVGSAATDTFSAGDDVEWTLIDGMEMDDETDFNITVYYRSAKGNSVLSYTQEALVLDCGSADQTRAAMASIERTREQVMSRILKADRIRHMLSTHIFKQFEIRPDVPFNLFSFKTNAFWRTNLAGAFVADDTQRSCGLLTAGIDERGMIALQSTTGRATPTGALKAEPTAIVIHPTSRRVLLEGPAGAFKVRLTAIQRGPFVMFGAASADGCEFQWLQVGSDAMLYLLGDSGAANDPACWFVPRPFEAC